jgi:hypothetical protein
MPPGTSESVNASLKEKPLGLSRRYRIRMQRTDWDTLVWDEFGPAQFG